MTSFDLESTSNSRKRVALSAQRACYLFNRSAHSAGPGCEKCVLQIDLQELIARKMLKVEGLGGFQAFKSLRELVQSDLDCHHIEV